MKNYLFLVLLGILLFSSCEEEVNFTSDNVNGSIESSWNLYAIRSYDCGNDLYDVTLGNSDTTFYIRVDSILRDSFVIDRTLGDTIDIIEILTIDSVQLMQPGIDSIRVDSIPELDPVSGEVISYLYRYTLNQNPNSEFNVDYSFDTIFLDDQVQQYVACESVFKFESGGNGTYSTQIFGQNKASGDLKWSELEDGTYEICFDGECDNYEVTISSQEALVMVNNNYQNSQNVCGKASYSLKKQKSYIGEYVWDQVLLENCYSSLPDSVLVFDSLECDISSSDPVVLQLGAVCNKLFIDCDNAGYSDIKGGPNEGVILLGIADLGSDRFRITFNLGNQNIRQYDAERDGDFFIVDFGEATTIAGLSCNVKVKYKKTN